MKPMNRRPPSILARAALTALLLALAGSRETFVHAATRARTATAVSISRTPALSIPSAPAPVLGLAPSAITPTAAPAPAKSRPASAKAALIGAALQAEALNAPAAGNDASKSAAAAAFEGNSEKAAGIPSAPGSAGAPGGNSPADIKAAFLAGIRKATAPGTKVSYSKVSEIGAGLGLNSDKASALFTKLLQAGHLGIRGNHDALYFSFLSRLQSSNRAPAPERAADVLASKAVSLINSIDSADHARAVAKADRAVTAYENIGQRTRQLLPQLEEARVLRANAMLEFFTDLLGANKKDLENRESQTLKLTQRVADLTETLQWLETATYQVGYVPPMPERVHGKLVALIGSLTPREAGGREASGEVADGYIAALDLLEKTAQDPQPKVESSALIPLALPAEAPVIAFKEIIFPDSKSSRYTIADAEDAAMVAEAMQTGGHLIITVLGSNLKGHSPTAVLVKLSEHDTSDPTHASVIMTALRPVTITGYTTAHGVLIAQVSYPQTEPSNPQRVRELGSLAQHALEQLAPLDPALDKDFIKEALAETNAERLGSLLAQKLPLSTEVKLQLLRETSIEARLQAVILEMTSYFKGKTAKASGDGAAVDSLASIEALKAKMLAIGMPEDVQKVAIKEFNRLARMKSGDTDADSLRTYLERLLDVPWSRRSEDNLDVAQARLILDEDHFGLDNVKEPVLERLMLRKKTGTKKGEIIALLGPAGVGKTSIAAAIARALGRPFVRLSLGGVHDESEIRGHRRTYRDALPGMVMAKVIASGVKNPVMLMDEVDKIGHNSNAGDPAAALLEVLDPEQNNTFFDHYLGVPVDLSEVLFVVTANELSGIPGPLRSRLKIIEFDGYTTLEKIEIAERHVVPQKLKATGLKPKETSLTRAAIRRVIEGYTMEAGVRVLRQKIEDILLKISVWPEMRGEQAPSVIDEQDVSHYLGIEEFSPRQMAQNGVGVATGLAVSELGGSTLNVEVSKEPGTGRLLLRKQFGNDIEDSARNAYKHVKRHAAELGLDGFDFTKFDVDINFTPAGKIDGPSAGGLMVTAIVSALTGRPVKAGVAMTGEITMRGDILPIGGLKQKVMAAHRMGYTEVIFPFANLKDIEGIPKEVRDGIKLTAVRTYEEIYQAAIEPAAKAIP